MPIVLAQVMAMVSQLWDPYKLCNGWPLNSQCFAHVGPTLVSEWHAHQARRGAHECLLAGVLHQRLRSIVCSE